MSSTWSAHVEYDQSRCGSIRCFGLKSREEAIAWLNKGYDWRLCWYLLPAWYIREEKV